MMAAAQGRPLVLWVALLLCFISPSTEFELEEREFEELGDDVGSLHILKGMANRFSHFTTTAQNHAADLNVLRASFKSEDGEDFVESILKKQKELNHFLKIIEDKKNHNVLLSASEVSYMYRNKLIFIMDTKAETLQQAEEEYSEDPHYSAKAEITCLESNTCPSAVSSGTVIRILGNLSEDGHTLSGHSGSSLASLMLNSDLHKASLFSFNSNTSRTFRNRFMRVFKKHDISVVLETTTQADHVYQTLDGSGSAIEYRVPKRPVDHSTQYDRQHILIMQDDPTVREAARLLYEKHPTVSSVYMLENQRPKLMKGYPTPLSAESRLVLVGHGTKGSDGEMMLGGYRAEEVAEMIRHMNIEEDEVKTTSVVACDVGSDEAFIKTLLKKLHSRSIETELHVRNSLVQVTHTGKKITAEITPGGIVWRNKDESKKVVAKLDRNFEPVIQIQSGHRGEETYSDATDFLGGHFDDTWPADPVKFVDQNFRGTRTDDIEALAWAFFNIQKGDGNGNNLQKLAQEKVENIDDYILNKIEIKKNPRTHEWTQTNTPIEDNNIKENIVRNCYKIQSGEDVLDLITHYASVGEQDSMHVMLNDWIYEVNPKSLYVYLAGKKVAPKEESKDIKVIIEAQRNKEKYRNMREGINDQTRAYSDYAIQTLQGKYTRPSNFKPTTDLATESWFSTYFMASVISESVRNFRSFPVTLMALDMSRNADNNIRERGQEILLNELPMTRGGTWLDPKKRGFHGSSTPSSDIRKKHNLKKIVEKEDLICTKWLKSHKKNNVDRDMLKKLHDLVHDTHNVESPKWKPVEEAYEDFKTKINSASASGVLGGSHDGPVTVQDTLSAAEVEHSLKPSSYYSRSSAMLAQHIHNELQRTYGEKLPELCVIPDSVMVENGKCHCQLVSSKSPQEIIEWKVTLPAEIQHQMEKTGKSMEKISETADMSSRHVERAGMALGTVGLMLGAKAAVQAFEGGDIVNGSMATLQTIHGVAGMSLAVVGKRVSASAGEEVMKGIAAALKNPVGKRGLVVIPVMGISFGIYNIEEDLKRRDTPGYIDAGFDSLLLSLDVVELAQPEFAPIIAPISLALSAIRMLVDDIYLDVQAELNKLPPNAGILEKIGAVIRGFMKGTEHFIFDVASFFYTIPYREIENGRRLVEQISDYRKYYTYREVQAGRKAIDFTGGESSWNGGSITFCLSEQGSSEFCLDFFVSANKSFGKKCWPVDTTQTDDIILGTGESHQLQYSEIQRKVLLFIPAGSVTVVSGYQALTHSRYGKYSGNSRLNNFFAVQTNTDHHTMEIMLSYYYELHGKEGDDTFYLGPQRSYVEGQAGRDTYVIPKDGGKTNINNYDPRKTIDLLMLGVNYDQISVSKSVSDVVLHYASDHSVRIINWFSGEEYRHMNIMSEDGIMFDISTAVFSSVKLTATAVNLMSKSEGQTVDTTQPLLLTVTNIQGSAHDDRLIGNAQTNVLDGGGGSDYMKGGEGEDVYIVNERKISKVQIENYSTDKATDVIMIEANLHSFKTKVKGDDLILLPFTDQNSEVTLINWFRSEEDRHLLVITKDLVTFSLSAEKSLCGQSDPIHSKCIRSHIIDYSRSSNPLTVDLENEAFQDVTEVRGSNLDDEILGNSQANIIIPGEGFDILAGGGGQDLYIVTPGYGIKIIFNLSPDLALDTLLLKEVYERIKPQCDGQDFKLFVNNAEKVQLKSWFSSKMSQHLQVRSADGITFILPSNSSHCGGLLKLPQSVDYRNEKRGQIMKMNSSEFASVVEMYGSPEFDVMTGNDNDNVLDPFTGGGRMAGGEGKDTYIIKPDYGTRVEIDNFAHDEKEDIVLFQVEFLSGNFTVYSENYDVVISVNENGKDVNIRLINYRREKKFQHLTFQSVDGVHFRVMSPFTNQSTVRREPWIEAYKVSLKGQRSDCHIDLSSQRNLSTIYTVQGCSDQSNHIVAGDLDRVVFGGLKDDVLNGGDGHDTLIGGQGNDVLLGSSGNDTLYGEDGDDTLLGGPGWDIFIPGRGADVMDGGSGRDTVLYQGDHETGTGVYISLLSGEGHQADAEGDALKDVENVIGTIYPDVLISGHEPALLKGSDGDDVLVSVTEGDTLIGGDGRDIYMMVPHQGWITVDNCAEDNARDVLFLPSVALNSAECKQNSSGLWLKFHTANDSFIGIFLKNWVKSTHECGHLTLIIREGKASVERIQQDCRASSILKTVESAYCWAGDRTCDLSGNVWENKAKEKTER